MSSYLITYPTYDDYGEYLGLTTDGYGEIHEAEAVASGIRAELIKAGLSLDGSDVEIWKKVVA